MVPHAGREDYVMLTILHLVSLKGMGGRAATAIRQVRLLAGRGHRVLLACLPGSAIATRGRELGLEVYADFRFSRGFKPFDLWHDCRSLAVRCAANKVDVVHAHLSQESWVACIGARLLSRRPIVIRSRGVVVPVVPHIFNRLMHNHYTDHVVAPSRVIYEHLRSLPGFNSEKVALIPDGVDLLRFSPELSGVSIRHEFGISEDTPLVVMVARLEAVKGHDVFFAALKRLLSKGNAQKFRALCACDERTPGAFDRTVANARALGLPESFLTMTGFRNDIEKIIAAADVIALPSLGSEGSSRVALEAAAAGVPVVGSSVGCLPEVIENGVTGIIVPPRNSEAMAEAIQSLIENPERARQMGVAARARAEKLYDEQVMVEKLEALYILEVERNRGKGLIL